MLAVARNLRMERDREEQIQKQKQEQRNLVSASGLALSLPLVDGGVLIDWFLVSHEINQVELSQWVTVDYVLTFETTVLCRFLFYVFVSGDLCEQIMQYDNRIQRMQQQIKDAKQSASGLTPQGLSVFVSCLCIM